MRCSARGVRRGLQVGGLEGVEKGAPQQEQEVVGEGGMGDCEGDCLPSGGWASGDAV